MKFSRRGLSQLGEIGVVALVIIVVVAPTSSSRRSSRGARRRRLLASEARTPSRTRPADIPARHELQGHDASRGHQRRGRRVRAELDLLLHRAGEGHTELHPVHQGRVHDLRRDRFQSPGTTRPGAQPAGRHRAEELHRERRHSLTSRRTSTPSTSSSPLPTTPRSSRSSRGRP